MFLVIRKNAHTAFNSSLNDSDGCTSIAFFMGYNYGTQLAGIWPATSFWAEYRPAVQGSLLKRYGAPVRAQVAVQVAVPAIRACISASPQRQTRGPMACGSLFSNQCEMRWPSQCRLRWPAGRALASARGTNTATHWPPARRTLS